MTALAVPFVLADEMRRRQGRMLDLIGPGHIETPFRLAFARPGVKLRVYQQANGDRPVLVIVPAPIKRPYVWDLAPSVSVVQRCIGAGLGVYLIEWTEPGPDTARFGLADYADRLILECLDAIGKPVVLAGHSLGGTLAAIFAALHPERLRGLVLLEAPLSFGADAGELATNVRQVQDVSAIRASFGDIPGTLLDAMSVVASPGSFLWERWADRIASFTDPQAMETNFLVERWMLDEFPLPGCLFEEIIERLYREDRFILGTLSVGDSTAAAGGVTAPVLCTVDRHSRIIPPGSVLPFLSAVRSQEKQLLHYQGDTGVALRHVGVLVGRNAHHSLWPRILAWVRDRYRA